MRYPAIFEPDGVGFVVSFPDIPEALTSGATEDEALAMAADALVTAMEFYVEDRRQVPLPSDPKAGERLVDLPASAAAKVLLLNAMIEAKVSNAELARRIGTSAQTVTRIVDLAHPTKIDTIAKALQVLGKRLELYAVSA